MSLPSRALAANFTVISLLDGADATAGDGICETVLGNGVCTLRAAIGEANALAGTDTINFTGLSGTISPASDLPTITAPVTIDASTASGASCGDLWAGTPPTLAIILYGVTSSLTTGFTITGGGTTIKGFDIQGFTTGTAYGIHVSSTGSNSIECNSITANTDGVFIDGSSSNTIGGTAAGKGNIVSGNTVDGITIGGIDSTGNSIVGNFIGTNAAGSGANGNSVYGILVTDTAYGNTIGSTTSMGRNLISGNTDYGLNLSGTSTTTLIVGNYIGTNRDGTSAISNSTYGVSIGSDSNSNTIGGTIEGARNIISSNTSGDIYIAGDATTVQGNYIGLTAAGTAGLDGSIGVALVSGAADNVIGGTVTGASNVISGHTLGAFPAGVINYGDTETGNTILGNSIGLNAAGTAAIPNNIGIELLGSNTNVGGTTSAARNIVSGNTYYGIAIGDGGSGAADNIIQGNYIGIAADGSTSLANGWGIVIGNAATNNTIGGTATGAGNVIANNTNSGIGTDSTILTADAGTGNAFLRNSIYSNGSIGIDLAPYNNAGAVTANDANDADTGPNNYQNFPVLTSAATDGVTTTVVGTLNSVDPGTYRVEFFATPTADGTGYGEGQTYLGSTSVSLSGSNNVSFAVTGLSATTVGYTVSATASKDEGGGYYSTSEFSADVTAALSAVVDVSILTATSTPAYTNLGLATTTRARVGDTIQYQLTLDGTPLVSPQINIFNMGSTTMSGSGTNWYYATTTANNLTESPVAFMVSAGGTTGVEATTTATQADMTGTNVTFDKTAPTLSSVAWTDADSSKQFSAGDTLLLTWSETMATTTLTSANLNTVLGLTNNHTFSTTTAPTWNTAGTQLTITLGAASTVTAVDTVQPTTAVRDAVGNTASGAQTAITLPDTTAPASPTGLSNTNFNGSVDVTLVSTGSSDIHYTTDGTTPTCTTGTVYISAITIPDTTTLKALGCDEADNASSVVTAEYTENLGSISHFHSSSSASTVNTTVPAVAHASGLSSSQIGSILSVLASFGADSATIAKVQSALSGTAITGSVTSTAVHIFKDNLTLGSLGSEVKALQRYLNAHGYPVSATGAGSPGNETTIFGAATRAALMKYQKAKGITPAAGFFGPLTRAAMNAGQ